MTAVKVGDRVRCTLGESVVVGVVLYEGIRGLFVNPDGWGPAFFVVENDGWTVEILPPPAPPLPEIDGTVVLDGSGFAWQRKGDLWWCRVVGCTTLGLRDNGPLTVIHVPEVTP